MTTKRIMFKLGLAVVLFGCTGTTPTQAPATATAPPVVTTAPATQLPPTEEPCREVTHAAGDSCVPANPQRVVTLGCQTSLEYALALGLPIVGHDVAPWPPEIPPYVDASRLAGSKSVGSCFEPDLELVKPLNPDLIIYTFDAGNYAQVSAIAPTVVLPVGYLSYRDDFLTAAELLGRTDEANAHLAALDSRIAALKAKLALKFAGKTVAVFGTGTDGRATIETTGTYVGELMTDLGLERPAAQVAEERLRISLEQIGLLDADVAFATFGYTDPSTAEAGAETKAQYTENALWQTLKFVQDNQLIEMDKSVWSLHGIFWADGVLQDLEAKALP
ncbi:MAG TPA: iron-siderophore ABC transporter substrate-binding protein [Candidatus Limnocylindria bacterium]|nr:iron-siderophore ABC transporter substrate-binding protein [Candidatus Limnocylindria bacterium]